MTALAVPLAVRDARTMLRRNLRHMVRYPSLTLFVIGLPLVFLLLFVLVLGGTLGAGLGGDRARYADYVTPAILVMTVAGTATGTAVSVAMDMTQGIVDRFRTMNIARSSVLTGHVLAAVLQALLAVAVVALVALLVGFRPAAGPLGWLGAAGLVALLAVALSWLAVAFGLLARSVETASNMPTFLVLLPFLGSGFVPTASMPAGLAWFAEHQPFTPVIETLRALLFGAPPGPTAALAVAWLAGIAAASWLWARHLSAKAAR